MLGMDTHTIHATAQATPNYGAVFTRRWVVDLMLDTCGYVPEADLAAGHAVEPSCGDGAFLLPMVKRLSDSLRLHGRPLNDAMNALAAYDVQEKHVRKCRTAVTKLLEMEGWDVHKARHLAHRWVREEDYLLREHGARGGVAWVIGNPPYIRSEDLDPELRARYLEACPTMTVGADIFVGFIEQGLRSLGPGGRLCYIVADRWMHNSYGKRLRGLVARDYAMEACYELHGVDAFAEEVSAYPAITQIRRGPQGAVRYVTGRPEFDADAAGRLLAWSRRGKPPRVHDAAFSAALLRDWFHTDALWPSASPDRLAILEDLNERCRPLEDPETGTRLGIGIATGADAVFIVREPDGIEPDRLLPLVMTEHTRNGRVRWQDAWLTNPWTEDGRLVPLDRYPGLARHLEAHGERLRERHTARKSGEAAWFRTIDKVNPTLAARPKLLFQDMKATIQPVLDEGGLYPHHNLYWLTSEKWDLRVLGGLLLSRVAEMFVAAYGVKMRGGTMRFQAQYLRLIRVPDPDAIAPDVAARLVQAFDSRDTEAATRAALEAYSLDGLPD